MRDNKYIESKANKEEYDETEANCIIHFLGAQTRRAEIESAVKIKANKLLEDESVINMRIKFVYGIISHMEYIYNITKSRAY